MKKCLGILIFCFPIVGFAQGAFSIETLAKMQESGQAEQAYQYALANQAQGEGDPEYDFYYGMAAIDTGHVSQGVFALERVLLVEPENHFARLELARGYFLLEEYERSREEFESVLELNPPKNVQTNINQYMSAIHAQQGRYRTSSSLYISFGGGNDDNVSSGPASFDAYPELFGFILADASDSLGIQQEDTYQTYDLGYQLDVPLSVGWSFSAGLQTEGRNYQEFDTVSTSTSRLNLGINLLSDNDRYRFSVSGQQFDVDGEDYRLSSSVGFDWRRRLSSHSQLQLFLQSDVLEYETQSDRDSTVTSLGLGYLKEFSIAGAPLIFMNVYTGQESPDIETVVTKAITERDLQGVTLGMQWRLSGAWSLLTSYSVQNSKYAGEDAITSLKRKDDYASFDIELNWVVAKLWDISLSASSAESDSNIEQYVYERAQFGLNFRRSFEF